MNKKKPMRHSVHFVGWLRTGLLVLLTSTISSSCCCFWDGFVATVPDPIEFIPPWLDPGVKMTIMVYSGRPDPTLVIDDNAVLAKLREAYSATRPDDAKTSRLPSNLGYSGMRIQNDGVVEGLPDRFVVYRNIVEVVSDGKRTRRTDPTGALEALLIQAVEASNVVSEEVLQTIRRK